MTAAELIKHMRGERGRSPPAGDLHDPALLAELLTIILSVHLEAMAANAARKAPPPAWDSTLGRFADSPAAPAPDPTDDEVASSLALLAGYLEDLRR